MPTLSCEQIRALFDNLHATTTKSENKICVEWDGQKLMVAGVESKYMTRESAAIFLALRYSNYRDHELTPSLTESIRDRIAGYLETVDRCKIEPKPNETYETAMYDALCKYMLWATGYDMMFLSKSS